MANCRLLLTSGDQLLRTSGDLLTLTTDCSAPANPTHFITWTEHTTATWQEHTRTAWVEHTHATHQEG